jgi:adenine phosphoribosyltransferase
VAGLRENLKASFRWLGDRTDPDFRADVTGWWRDPSILEDLGPALAALFPDSVINVVMGTQSRGSLVGVLTARALGVGLAEVRKDPGRAADSDAWWERPLRPITVTDNCGSVFGAHFFDQGTASFSLTTGSQLVRRPERARNSSR